MTRTLRMSLLIASLLVVSWTTSSQACHRRRAVAPQPCGQAGYTSVASPMGYYSAEGGNAATGGGYYQQDGGYAGYPGGGYGYGYGRPYNPGGLGGPASGMGVRPGLGFGGLGRGR